MRARAAIVTERDADGRTLLATMRSDPPITLRRTGPGQVHLVSTAAGPLGGDDLALDIEVAPGTALDVGRSRARWYCPAPPGRVADDGHRPGRARGRHCVSRPEPTVLAMGCHAPHGRTAGTRRGRAGVLARGDRLRPVRRAARQLPLPLRRHVRGTARCSGRSSWWANPAIDGSPAVYGDARCVGSTLMTGRGPGARRRRRLGGSPWPDRAPWSPPSAGTPWSCGSACCGARRSREASAVGRRSWSVSRRSRGIGYRHRHRSRGLRYEASVVEAQAAQLLGVALPVLGDADPAGRGRPGAEQRLDLWRARLPTSLSRCPCARSRWPSGTSARRTCARRCRAEVVAALAGRHLLDDDRDRVRQLVANALQGRLADQLAHQHLLGLVGELAARVQRRALGSRWTRRSASTSSCSPDRRDRDDLGPSSTPAELVDREQLLGDLLGVARSHLVTTATIGVFLTAVSFSAMKRSPVPMGSLAGTQKPITSTSVSVDRTRLSSRSPSSVRGLCKPGVSTMMSWESGRCTMPRTAWRVVWGSAGGDRHLRADQRVRQRGLAGVGPADEAGETGMEISS